MSRRRLSFSAPTWVCLLVLAGCSEGKKSGANGGEPASDAAVVDSGSAIAALRVSGTVLNAESGVALERAILATGSGAEATSTADGSFVLEPAREDLDLDATRPSFAPTFKPLPRAGGSMDVYLKSNDETLQFQGAEGITVRLPSGVKLEIPKNAVLDAAGKRASGLLTLEFAAVDGHQASPAAALPGDATAERKDQTPGRLSVEDGLSIRILDAEQKELDVDKAAEVVAEVPARKDADTQIAVYSYGTKERRWKEEGRAQLRMNAEGKAVYRADIDHLSWWALGRFFDTVSCVRACVKDGDGRAVQGAQVWVVGASIAGVSTFFTDNTGCGAGDGIAAADVVLVAQAGKLSSNSKSVRVGTNMASAAQSPLRCEDAGTLTIGQRDERCVLCSLQESAPPPDDGGMSYDSGTRDAGLSLDASAGADAALMTDAATPDAAPPFSCATGTADCDGDPTDCETNTATDTANCGRCDRVCGAAAACTDGRCGATVLLDPTSVNSNFCGAAFSNDKVFVITCWGTSISEVRYAPLEPGASVDGTQVAVYSGVPVVALRGILVRDEYLYFGLEGSPSHVYKYPVSGTGTVTTEFTDDNAVRFDDLQVVDGSYYWLDNAHTTTTEVGSAILKTRSLAGTTDTDLVTGLGKSYNLKLTANKLIWLEARTSNSVVNVYRAPRSGTGGNINLVQQAGVATPGSYLTARDGYAYWTVKSAAPNGKIQRIAIDDDAAVAEDVVVNLNLPEGIVSDGAYLYFKQLDVIYRAPIDGSQPPEALSPTVAANDAQATAIYGVDDRYIYFAAGPTAGDSKLMRVAK